MDHRTLYGVAAVFLSGAIFVHSLTSANALPTYPTGTSYNEFPYESIQCDVCLSTDTILSVPSDKYFILTAASNGPTTSCKILVDGQETHSDTFRGFRTGEARLVVPSNSVITTHSSTCYIEGYYADPNGINLESVYGEIAPNSTATLLSVPSDKNFILTGISWTDTALGFLKIYSDNAQILKGGIIGNDDHEAIFAIGNGHLKVAAGTELKLENTHTTFTGRYYIQGYYAPL